MLESYRGGDVKFVRIDADVAEALKGDAAVAEDEALTGLFKEASGSETLTVRLEALKDETVPVILNVSEEARRMEEMMKLYGMSSSGMPTDMTLVVNASSPLVGRISALLNEGGDAAETARTMASYLFQLAKLSQKHLDADEMKAFLADSFRMLGKL
jgi:molecular chaperone HtpG